MKQYMHEKYKFFNEKFKKKFSADPEAYLPQEELDDSHLKPLILILGPYGDGKENIIEELASKLNLDVLDVKSRQNIKQY